MSGLFSAYSFGHLALKNRFVRSATGESRADDEGILTEEIFPIYEALAAGGVGLIITGHMYVHPDWRCGPRQTGIWGDRHVSGLRRLAKVSQGNGAKVVAQINYPARSPDKMDQAAISESVDAFVAAASRAKEAGFDGVQIHAAHGFLLSGFLTPAKNGRTDEYGSDAGGRRRLLLEIVQRTRETLGSEYPILCKLGVVDGGDNSLPLAEAVETANELQGAGIDAIEISSTFAGAHAKPAAEGIDKPEKEAYFATQARAVKQAVGVPIILVGGLRSLEVMDRVVHEGVCDMVSICRPFIREPDLVNKLHQGQTLRSACVSCNKCYNPQGFHCVHAKNES